MQNRRRDRGKNTIYSKASLRRNWWGGDSAGVDDTSNGFGVAKVRTNDGTTRAGLPWEEDIWAKEECVENPVPAVHKAEAWELKSWSGMPPSMADEELLVAWSRTLEFLDGSGPETDACSAGNKALTAWTTAARNSGDGWAALPATVVDALWANRRMRWNRRCGRTIRCPCGEKGSILTVTSALRASRARHILQLKARIRNRSAKQQIRKDQLKNASVRCNLSYKIGKRSLWTPLRSRTLEEETADRIGL